jgi:hypothetical protein
VPVEEGGAFVYEARRVKATLEAIRRLQSRETIPHSLWQAMGSSLSAEDAQESWDWHQQIFFYLMAARIAFRNEPHVKLGWDNGPQVKIVPSLGFLHAVNLLLVQEFCQAVDIYQCSNCGHTYVRTGNKPASRKNNYCKPCRRGKRKSDTNTQRASKKLSARRRRALERRAQQLFAEGITIEDISQQLKPEAGKITVDPETIQKWVAPKGSEARG